MESKIEIFKSKDNSIELQVALDWATFHFSLLPQLFPLKNGLTPKTQFEIWSKTQISKQLPAFF
jgi:hypothetical protein